MFRPIPLALLYFTALPVAVAAPSVTYKPVTGEFWIFGTQQPDGYAGLILYSASGRLIEATTPFLVGYPLEKVGPDYAPFGEWLRKEVTVTVPVKYNDPLYLGTFVSPGTSAEDLTARYLYVSFARRLTFDQVLPIRDIPEPATASLVALAVAAGLWVIRRRKR